MRCPECKTKKRARPQEYELVDLIDHMLNSHPMMMISMARTLMKEQAIDATDVVFRRDPDAP